MPQQDAWEVLGAASRFAPGRLVTVTPRRRRPGESRAPQLVVGRTEAGQFFALDNRCPHEGYPLAQGDLDACTLTCNWHNWKFRLDDGVCLIGGEDVRAYPVRLRDGIVEVNLAEPPPEVLRQRARASLDTAMFENDTERALRDAARLLQAGETPWRILAHIAHYDALHAEDGTTHVLPVAADCGRLVPRFAGVETLAALAPAIELCAETNVRLPSRPLPAPLRGASVETFVDAIEAEEAERAEGLLHGALAAGVPVERVDAWICRALSAHFLDFGHPLIYLVKARAVLAHASNAAAADILGSLVRRIVLGTREDRLPYMQAYFRRVRAYAADFAVVAAREKAGTQWEPEAVRDAVLDGSANDSVDAVWSALERGVPAADGARALVGAGAHRLMRFDVRWDADPSVAENWLWATHRFTFASAVRQAVERWPAPERAWLLFQAVAFIHSGKPLDGPLARPAQAEPASVDALVAAIEARREDQALALAGELVRHEADVAPVCRALEELCLADRYVLPIFTAHAIKTTLAATEEAAALQGHPDRNVPLLAAVRFLAAPVRERILQADVRTTLAWIVEGRVPRKLTQ